MSDWMCVGQWRRKARKKHQCLLCLKDIEAGSYYIARSGLSNGEGFYTMKMHEKCEEVTRKWGADDWEYAPEGAEFIKQYLTGVDAAKGVQK